jgi:hypothetical protein
MLKTRNNYRPTRPTFFLSGISRLLGAGKVYVLKSLNDCSTNYAAAQAGFGRAWGMGAVNMKNGAAST